MDNVELMRALHEPYERGEGDPDWQSIWDAMHEDVVYDSPVGRLQGRQTMIEYFVNVAELAEFSPFQRPIDYFSDGDRVVMMCEEEIHVKATGERFRGEWIWVLDIENGLITRVAHFLRFEDVTILIEQMRRAYDKTAAAAA